MTISASEIEKLSDEQLADLLLFVWFELKLRKKLHLIDEHLQEVELEYEIEEFIKHGDHRGLTNI